jgi:4a-hydroxytetrahydrobiopterin dehydratase
MIALTEQQLQTFLADNAAWSLVDGAITREWTFAGFPEAIAFVDQVARMAEAAGHHPDIDIRYNRVRLTLVTHDAGGITPKDAALAQQVDEIT